MTIKTSAKKRWSNVMRFLRDPAWNFGSCLVAFVFGLFGIFGLLGISSFFSAITGKLQRYLLWLSTPITIPRIYIALVIISILLVLFPIIYKIVINIKSRHKENKTSTDYYQFWNVLWKGTTSFWEPGAFVEGPFCLEHNLKLTIDVDNRERKFRFHCPGIPESGKHIILGPEFDALIKPTDRRVDTFEELFIFDVIERIEALWREKGRY